MTMEAAALPEAIRVLIADDHLLFAQAVEAVLATEPQLEVVGHAAHGAAAVELVRELSPEVVLMDIAMPVMDGFEATERIRAARPGACVVMLTGSNAGADVDRSRKAGAVAYVTKDRIAADLVDAIVDAAAR
jgi:DNA-binding NarL/FixJ family response regulator